MAQVVAPQVALAEKRCDAAASRVAVVRGDAEALAIEEAVLTELTKSPDSSKVRPSMSRWPRYAIRGATFIVEFGVGLFVAEGMNLTHGWGIAATMALLVCAMGELTGSGLRRLDLRDRITTGGRPDPDIGSTAISRGLVGVGALTALLLIGATFAAQVVTEANARRSAEASQAIAGLGVPGASAGAPAPVESTPLWALMAVSVIAGGGYAMNLALAMRAHPQTKRIEHAEFRVVTARWRLHRHIRPARKALGSAGRDLALAAGSLDELACRTSASDAFLLRTRYQALSATMTADRRFISALHTRKTEPLLSLADTYELPSESSEEPTRGDGPARRGPRFEPRAPSMNGAPK